MKHFTYFFCVDPSRLVIFSVVKLPKERSLSTTSGYEMMDVDSDDEVDRTTDEVVDELALRPDQIPWTFEHVERPGEIT
jgi:hypothetical protein